MIPSQPDSSSVEVREPRAADRNSEPFRFFWVFLLALIPLALTVFWPYESLNHRMQRLVDNHPHLAKRLQQAHTLDELASLFPGNRVPGALFARRTYGHWAIGSFAASTYLILLYFMFPGTGKRIRGLFLAGLFSGTVGILLLLTFQQLASLPHDAPHRGEGLSWLILLILQPIGYSYRCASDPNIGFWGSFFGFTFGVGLCEELCKALPVWLYLTWGRRTGWRGACVVGLASGIGFGVAEGIMYSEDLYNGIRSSQIYFVRFCSCVALHAMWSGSVALLMYKHRAFLDIRNPARMLLRIVYYLWAAILLHGMYDTLLKQDLPYTALVIGFVSYWWLFRLVAESRGT